MKYRGLTTQEAKEFIKKYGKNEISEKRIPIWLKFLKKFWGPIPWLLEFTCLLTFILHKYADSAVIFGLLIFNGVVSFWHELSAENALELLKKHLNIKAKVLRDDKWQEVDASEITINDIVLLQSGFAVPADIEILDGVISVDQSAITGESLPKSLKPGDTAYMGSFVVRGEAIGKVKSIGQNTFFGKSAKLVQEAGVKTQLEKVVFELVKYLFIFGVLLIIVLFGLSLYKGFDIKYILPILVVMLLPIIPAALPAAFTLSTALGAKELAKNGVLTTRLSAIESAASMDILCTDKTGTITKNKITIEKILPMDSFTQKDVICYAVLSSDPKQKDPIENAIFEYLKDECKNKEKLSFEPFDPSNKYSTAKILEDQKEIYVYKGSPKVAPIKSQKQKDMFEDLASIGLRVLAVWIKKDNEDILVGFIGFSDPPREDSKELIQKIKDLGVSVKMITGDTEQTAKHIANLVGIEGEVCNAKDIKESCGVFAGVLPEDKFKIVKTYQEMGHTVGMTGDGINDAPALKQADFGIAVSNATDVAKAAASVVLTNEGLVNIVSAIILSRKIYQRLLTYIFSKTIRVFTITITIFAFFLIDNTFILTTKMIISMFFFSDFLTLSLATDNVGYSKTPDKWNIKNISFISFLFGAFSTIWTILTIYLLGHEVFHLDIESIKTVTFLALVLTIPVSIFSVRERTFLIKHTPSKTLLWSMVFAVIGSNLMAYFGILMKSLPIDVILVVDLSIFLMFLPFNVLKLFIMKP
ncbi:MAG: plasma-membrane proton-efflux P-type ATPase [Hydrogenothermaceae bacterium]